MTPRWLDYSLALKLNKDADTRFGWVLEMWGYSIAAASLGIKHDVLRNFQVGLSTSPGPISRLGPRHGSAMAEPEPEPGRQL